MGNLQMSRTISASPERVFEVFTDFEHAADNISAITNMELLDDGPPNVGWKWRETRKVFKEKTSTETFEITAWEPDTGYTVGCDACGMRYITEFRFRPEDSGTRVEMEMKATPIKLAAKIIAPITGFMFSGMMKKCMQADFDELKAVAESA